MGAAVGPVCPPLLATARCPEAGSVREGPCWRQSCFGGAISVSEGGPLRWMTGRAGQGVGPVGRQREIRPRGRSREHQPRGPFMCPHKAGAIILCSSPAQPRGPRALSVLGGSIPPWSRVAGGLGPPADMECLSSRGAAQAERGHPWGAACGEATGTGWNAEGGWWGCGGPGGGRLLRQRVWDRLERGQQALFLPRYCRPVPPPKKQLPAPIYRSWGPTMRLGAEPGSGGSCPALVPCCLVRSGHHWLGHVEQMSLLPPWCPRGRRSRAASSEVFSDGLPSGSKVMFPALPAGRVTTTWAPGGLRKEAVQVWAGTEGLTPG